MNEKKNITHKIIVCEDGHWSFGADVYEISEEGTVLTTSVSAATSAGTSGTSCPCQGGGGWLKKK